MGRYAHIEPGGSISIDPGAWIAERTGGPDPDLTHSVRAGYVVRRQAGRGPEQHNDWLSAARAWCTEHDRALREPDLIYHDQTRLAARIWILRATVADRYPIAVIGVNAGPATVYADTCTDSGYWFDADSVDIFCPAGHGWTWLTGRELITARGDCTTITRVFGMDLAAPFTACPDCERARAARRPRGCGCDETPWIICPTCGQRCDVELPGR
jgi:hypothetical protein